MFFVFIFLNTLSAFAGPALTTYQAKIIKPDGFPLEASNVNFKFTILDAVGTCILYSEAYTGVNMTATGGVISFALGSGVKTYPVSSTTFEQVFSNITPNLSCDAGGPGSVSPAANDIRKIVMQFHDGAGWQTLPAMSINAVPYAMYATHAEMLGGVSATSFVQDSDLLTCGGGQALTFNGTSFSCVAVGGGGVTSSTIATALGYTPADGASITAVISSLGTANSTIASVSSTVFSVSSTVASLSNAVTSFSNLVAASFTAISGSGISSFNGSTSATQSFATGTAGTQPGFITAAGVHTLNIPFASAGSTTAGLISNTDYSLFSTVVGKVASSTASIAQALGYTPADAVNVTSLSNSVAVSITALNSNLASVSSTVTSLSNSVAASFAGLTSPWIVSGSAISYSGTANVSGSFVLGNTPPVSGTFDFGPLLGSASTYKTPFLLQETITDFSNAYTAGHISSFKLNASANTSSLAVGNLRYTNVAPSTVAYSAGIYGDYAILENNLSGSLGVLAGHSPLVLQNGPGTVSNIYGTNSRTYIYQGSVNSSFGGVFASANFAGTVQNNYGIMIDAAGSNVTNNYGLFVTDQTIITASQTFNIYSAGFSSKNAFMGHTGIGLDKPSAKLHIAAGTAALASLKLTSGTLLTSPQSGSIEYDGFNLYYTDGTNTRRAVANTSSSGVTSESITTALGYTPANSSTISSLSTQVTSLAALVSGGAVSQWVTSGSAISFSGMVGIGLTSPTAALDVGNQIAAGSRHTWLAGNIGILPIPGNDTLLGTAVLGWNASNAGGETNLINAKGPGSPGGFTFDQWDGTTRSTRMNIHGTTGYVGMGIGTSSPVQQLEVSGVAQATKFYAGDGAFNSPSITFANNSNTGFYNGSGNLGISVGGGLKGTWSSNSLGFNAGGAGPQIYFTGGNAAAPSYAFNVDSDTGMFNPNAGGGSNELGFSTSGVERVRITAGGNLAVMTQSASGAIDVSWGGANGFVGGANISSSTRTHNTDKWFRYGQVHYSNAVAPFLAMMTGSTSLENGVHFGGGTALQPNATALRFYTGTSLTSNGGATERLSIISNGNVGVGVATPTAKVHIVGQASGLAGFKLSSGTLLAAPQAGAIENDGNYLYYTNEAGTRVTLAGTAVAGYYDAINTIANAAGNIALYPNIGAGSVIVSSTLASTSSNTGSLVVKGGMGVVGDIQTSGTIFSNALQGNQDLYLNPNGGKVGIGTTAPLVNLHVSGTLAYNNILMSSGNYSAISAQGGSISGWPLFQLSNQAANGKAFNIEVGRFTSDSFGIHDNGSNTTRLLITTSGAVGIGTNSPSEKLEITGKLKLTNGFGASNAAIVYGNVNDYMFLGAQSGSSVDGAAISLAGASNTVTGASSGGITFVVPGMSPAAVIKGTTGNVGIGTATPTAKLHVAGDIYSTGSVQIQSGTASAANVTNTILRLSTNNSGSAAYYGVGTGMTFDSFTNNSGTKPIGQIASYLISGGSGGAATDESGGLKFLTKRSASSTPGTVMVLDGNGSMGLGTASPSSTLSIFSLNNINTGSNFAAAQGSLRISDGTSIGIIMDSNQIEQTDISNFLYLNYNSSAGTIMNYGGGPVTINTLTAVPGSKLTVSSGGNPATASMAIATTGSFGGGLKMNDPGGNVDGAIYTSAGHLIFSAKAIATSGFTNHLYVSSAGNVGVGIQPTTYKLDVAGDLRISGNAYRDGGAAGFNVTSDARLKDIISTYDHGLKDILSIDTVMFRYKKDSLRKLDTSKEFSGVLAQQVQKVIPEAVEKEKDGFLSLNTTPIFWAMLNAIKEVYHEVMGIKAENAQLRSVAAEQARKIQSLEEENAAVKARLERIEKALEKTK